LHEGRAVEAGHAEPVGIAGAAAAALAIKYQRHPPLLGQAQHAVDLLVVHMALGAGQHGVIVGDHHAAGVMRTEFFRVDGGNAGDQAIRRRVLDEVVDLAPAALGGDRQRAVFDEGTRIDQLRDVFPRRSLIGLAPARDRRGAIGVERHGMPCDQFRQIGPDVVEIDCGFYLGRVARDLGGFEKQDGLAVHQRHAASGGNLCHLAAVRCRDEVFHLHRLEDGDLLPRTNHIAFGHLDGDDGALQRRRHRDRSRRAGGRIRQPGRLAPPPPTVSPSAKKNGRAIFLDEPTSAATWVSIKPVLRRLPTKSGCNSTAWMNGILVSTPAMRNSRRARAAFRTTSDQLALSECTMTLASKESKAALGPVAAYPKGIDPGLPALTADRTPRASRRSAWSRPSRPSLPC
jgi:hypothetical protein